MQKLEKIFIDGLNLKIEDVIKVTREGALVELKEEAKEKINLSRKKVEEIIKNPQAVYGINTGFGKFCNVKISENEGKILQKNLIMSHSCGVGNPLPGDIVKGIMLLRANALSRGNSGIRLSTVETIIEMINKNVVPVVPEKGSLGASGDLAPLSHVALVIMGMGEAFYNGERMTGNKAMEKAGIKPVELTEKEGLALINGTQVMTSVGVHTIYDSLKILRISDIAAALTMEALQGITDAFDERIHELRGQSGQIRTAKNLRNILSGSSNVTRQGELRVQDAYTLRCVPQIHGASKDALEYVYNVLEKEINAVTDNPIIFPETDDVISGGNFHGQPVAIAMDFLGIAVSELGNVSERRTERLVNPALSGLPAFLAENGGLNSGFMIAQYSAASLVSENKVLAHPASVDSIPSSANQEDHVSMGTIAARKAKEIAFNVNKILSIEILTACQAIDIRNASDKLSDTCRNVYERIRKEISYMDCDRVLYPDIEKVSEIIFEKSFNDEILVNISA